MPFTFRSAFFLCLVQVLASHPTDPFFYPWREEPPSQRISPYPVAAIGREVLTQRNASRGAGMYGYEIDRRGGHPRDDRRGVLNYPQGGFEGGQFFQARSFDDTAVESYLSAGGYERESVAPQSFAYSFSSHVKYGGESLHRAEKATEEASRARDLPNARIVTPKGGRRPSHGNKNENRPSNAISTTEKTSGSQTTKGSKRPRPPPRPPGGDIVFPGGYPNKFVPRVSKCARKLTFCEQLGEEYPGEYISQVLKKEGVMFREFFGQDLISDPNITERINAPEENSLCPYRQEVVFPRAAQNKEDKWLFVVNQDQYVQGVTVEVCLNPESRCILTEGFPLGYTPYCKQKYIERRLVAIGEDGKPHTDSFRLPSCCSCVVKHDTAARMAAHRSMRSPRGHLP